MEAHRCALCRRLVNHPTRHHLIPRTRHKNKKNKKTFSRIDVKERLIFLCRPCHSTIHTILSNKELEREYNTLEALRSHPDVQKFIAWVQAKPDGTTIRSRERQHR